ncbi:PIN domain-containing protein, partial [Gilvimarinus sp. 1_MG-2023]
GKSLGSFSILLDTFDSRHAPLSREMNDNKIINGLIALQEKSPHRDIILITKDINMRLKARGCGIGAQDYQNDQMLS